MRWVENQHKRETPTVGTKINECNVFSTVIMLFMAPRLTLTLLATIFTANIHPR